MAELSVIVPVYNSEKYVARCVDSLLRQTYRDMEICLTILCITEEAQENFLPHPL